MLCRAHVTTSFVQGEGHTALFKVKVTTRAQSSYDYVSCPFNNLGVSKSKGIIEYPIKTVDVT